MIRPIFIIILLLIPVCSLSAVTINDLYGNLSKNDFGQDCKSSPQEFFQSIQASTLYHLYHNDQYAGTRPVNRKMESFTCNNKGSSIYYYEYTNRKAVIDALGFFFTFIWGSRSIPTSSHPESIIVAENVVIVVSGKNISSIEKYLLEKYHRKQISVVSVGKLILEGLEQRKNNRYRQSIKSFEVAANLNNIEAQFNLCEILATQELYKQSITWCTEAANNGHSGAQLHLAKVHLSDEWGKPDFIKAKYLLEKASRAGNRKAIELLQYINQYVVKDISKQSLEAMERYLRCGKVKIDEYVIACNCMDIFRNGSIVDSKRLRNKRLVGISLAFNAGTGGPFFELAGLELRKNDSVSDKIHSFHVSPTEPGDDKLIESAIVAMLDGKKPIENQAYKFVSTNSVNSKPSIAWHDTGSNSVGTVINGFRFLLRQKGNTIVALEIHPNDDDIEENRFYITRYVLDD